ncbi:MAG: T9SS type A sorting domain-containing protein [Ignavibacteriae bacterium]|nr:T9SS type A sorting domain-containing protein [Ignavibacteriota bacterium]
MNRRDMLKSVGAFGIGSFLPFGNTLSADEKALILSSSCVLTPQETEGPYYFDPDLIRQDIREDTSSHVVETGIPLNMLFTVIDVHCNPISNVIVDIWHCDKDGNYSGYAGQPGGSTIGQNFLRGVQLTDSNGQCSFVTVYPGWYPGRVTHVHFKVRLSSTTYVTSQFCFPDNINTAVYQTSLYSGRGQNAVTNATDFAFQTANPIGQIMTITPNSTTGGYNGDYIIVIAGTTDVKESFSSPEEFALFQNYPNPFNPSTVIRYQLPFNSDVTLKVFDVLGREVATLVEGFEVAGSRFVEWDASNIPSGFYYYRIVAGNFIATREMLLFK